MQTSPVPVGPSRVWPAGRLGGLSAGRLVAGVVLALLLLGSRWYEEAVYAWLDAGWRLLSRVLPTAAVDAVSGPAMRGLLERPHSVPAAVLFAAGYVGLCWALLCVLLPPGEGWRWGLRLYGGVGLASLLLVVASHALGQPVLAALASRLLHMLLSPLPLMVLVPLLRWPGARAAG